jgi:transposase-like protein
VHRPGRGQARPRDLGSGQRGAKFWAGVCAELCNRGVRDVLIVCCDGLTGFPEATWPQSIVQTGTVHLLRAAMRFVSYTDRKRVAAALRPIYAAPTPHRRGVAWTPGNRP